MIKSLLILAFSSFISLAVGQQYNDYKRAILGNWSTCHDDGRYSEFYIGDSLFEFTINEDLIFPLTYQIKHDSLFLYFYYDSIIFDIWTIQIIDNDEILLISQVDSITKKSDYTSLTRINGDFNHHYKKRWKAKNCNDIRTDEEKEIEKQKYPQISIESDYFNKPKRTRKTN